MTADELAKLLDELQSRLEGPARYAFDLTVRQVVIEGVLMIVGAILMWSLAIAILLVSHRLWRRAWKRFDSGKGHSYEPDLFDYALGSIPAGFLALFGGWVLLDALPRLLNPEYAALERLLHLLIP